MVGLLEDAPANGSQRLGIKALEPAPRQGAKQRWCQGIQAPDLVSNSDRVWSLASRKARAYSTNSGVHNGMRDFVSSKKTKCSNALAEQSRVRQAHGAHLTLPHQPTRSGFLE